MKHKDPYVFGVVGYKNSGKTTLVCRFVEQLTASGFRVATVKHDGHVFSGFSKTVDSGKHFAAGARTSIVVSDDGHSAREDAHGYVNLPTLIQSVADVDIIIVEGFKQEDMPKWVLVTELEPDYAAYRIPDFVGPALQCQILGFVVPADPRCVAGSTIRVYDRNDIEAMTTRIVKELELR